MKKTIKAIVEKPAPKVKAEQSIISVVAEVKPEKSDSVLKTSNKPNAVAQKPAPEAKAGQPVILVSESVIPKKASPTQKSTQKAKVTAPKTVVPASETIGPKSENLSTDNIWPNWVKHLLVNFGIKK